MPRWVPSIGVLAVALLVAGAAQACSGRAPPPGGAVSGPVLAVPATGAICVALGPTPDAWVLVRLADGASLSPQALMAAAFAHRVTCVMTPTGRGRCTLDGADLATMSRSSEVRALAANWR